jgi:uncharacterized protein YyaL (SSP411 family)
LTVPCGGALIPGDMVLLSLLLLVSPSLLPLEVDQARRLIISEIELRFDHQHGGLQEKQKFPVPALSDALLLSSYRQGSMRHLQMATVTLDQMASGALYDHVGDGFFNHTRDAAWQVPRFLRNTTVTAALMSVYLRAYRQTGVERYRQTADGCRRFLMEEALQPDGFFAPGIGGPGDVWTHYYTWTREELFDLLTPPQAELVSLHWGIAPNGASPGPLGGRSVPHVARPLTSAASSLGITVPDAAVLLQEARSLLSNARQSRQPAPRPSALNADANAAAVIALLDAADILGDPAALDAAVRAADLLRQRAVQEPGGVFGVVPLKGGEPSQFGSLRTNAVVGLALCRVYLSTYQRRFLDGALSVASFCREQLWDASELAFLDYTAESDVPRLGEAKVDVNDAHLMSATSLTVLFLEELHLATDKDSYNEWAQAALLGGARQMTGRAHRAPSYVIAADRWDRGRVLVAVVGGAPALAAAARRVYHPWLSVAEVDAPPPYAPPELPLPCAVIRLPSEALRIETDPVAVESAVRANR